MRYVDAGYVIALSVLALYALSLVVRHRRLSRSATIAPKDAAGRAAGCAAAPPSPGRAEP